MVLKSPLLVANEAFEQAGLCMSKTFNLAVDYAMPYGRMLHAGGYAKVSPEVMRKNFPVIGRNGMTGLVNIQACYFFSPSGSYPECIIEAVRAEFPDWLLATPEFIFSHGALLPRGQLDHHIIGLGVIADLEMKRALCLESEQGVRILTTTSVDKKKSPKCRYLAVRKEDS